ncbi:MAG: GWxTD domain-containing protein [Bacteroidales bacterium]
MQKRKTGLLILFSVIFLSCAPLKRPVNVNFAHLYNADLSLLQPAYSVFHHHNDSTHLYIYINPEELLYTRQANEDHFTSRFAVSHYLFGSISSRNLIDSSATQFIDTLSVEQPFLIERKITFFTLQGELSNLFIDFEDINRRSHHQDVISIDKSHPYTSQFFTMQRNEDEEYFAPFFMPLESSINVRYGKELDFNMTVNTYPVHNKIPSPPFVMRDELNVIPELSADTTFNIQFNKGISDITTAKPGLYHFFDPDNIDHGFVAYAFNEVFPDVLGTQEMIRSLRYISSSDEYTDLFVLDDHQLASDRFWNRSAGNPDRAFELKNRYYNRVTNANILFSSFVPGWQTDRGMIYIVFGPPHSVYKNDHSEIWHYTEGMNVPPARFEFQLIDNKYSGNHYVLQRDPAYRSTWNHAVSIWRR